MKHHSLIFIVLLIAVMVSSIGNAAIENGVVTTNFDYSSNRGKYANHYIDYNPTSATFIYNDAGASTDLAGSVNVKNHKAGGQISINVETLASASLTVRIEGRSVNATLWTLIHEEVFTAIGSIVINILERPDNIRTGLKVVTNGVDLMTVRAIYYAKTQD